MSKASIQVRIVSQYGHKRVFPVCETAKRLCELAGGSTFTDRAIEIVKLLGYTIKITPTVPEEL